jgi:DNA-binding MarR family transcriptional regulator
VTPSPDHVARVIEQWRRERPDLDVSPQAVIGRVHRLANHLTAALVQVYGTFGLDEGEFDILATLRRAGAPFEMTPGDLQASTMVTSGAITKRVDRCVTNGWVARRVSHGDARSRIVGLTEAGLTLIDAAFTAHIANEHRLLGDLTAADRQVLEAVLQRWATQLGL